MKTRSSRDSRVGARAAAVVIGASAGGRAALTAILSELPSDSALPILIAQHLHSADDGGLARSLARSTPLRVIVPCDKVRIDPGVVCVAPADYHMLVEQDGTIALSVDARVNWSRPSIDVLFESAAHAYGDRLIAVILTGANADGTAGMGVVKSHGGMTIAQDPADAEYPVMPQAAIDAGCIDRILTLVGIGSLLARAIAENRETPDRG